MLGDVLSAMALVVITIALGGAVIGFALGVWLGRKG